MNAEVTTCSNIMNSNETVGNGDELEELREVQGINVWSQHQEQLEKQALEELEIFNKAPDIEEGEIVNKQKAENSNGFTLDIHSYIKRQEELRKKQEYKKTLSVSENSRNIANEITKKQQQNNIRKRKAKRKSIVNECINVKRKRREDVAVNSLVESELCHGNLSDGGEKSGSEYVPSEPDSDYEPGFRDLPSEHDIEIKPKLVRKRSEIQKVDRVCDDGSLKYYKQRLESYYKQMEEENELRNVDDDDGVEDVEIEPGFKCPGKVWNSLYGFQQEGLEWLWGLDKKSRGGLLGDEMGLGKTVQIIAFLNALNHGRGISKHGRFTGLGPTIIVSPSTVVHQWVKHFHHWAPEFRVAVLHQTGSYTGNKTQLIKEMNKSKGIIITTYQGILKYIGSLIELDWHYLILDEGHKIRNSSAKVSVAVKKIRTPHRILLTGSPMQNNLQELWSLFDFIVPGMLGTLQVFLDHFANPIMQGGYTNATPMQEALALSMATALKTMITPYLLRRAKDDVRQDICLPNKSEQVLFCSLTPEQTDLYRGYLLSEPVSMILGRGSKNYYSENQTKANVLMSITTLRKICNHPDIYTEAGEVEDENRAIERSYGYYKRSGKMIVVSALLKIWKRQGHRVLLFTQSRVMLLILQDFLKQQGYKHLKMDGTTAMASRQPLIEKFNQDTSFEVFLLTTRVGGLGVNLTGANRVIIYDPDWNPATDTQARERAWRIGQDKQVTIYRLLSAGTIEEKMYQRQVWKQLLSNKVLVDPKTQKFFKTSDLHDLFSLQEQVDNNPETANIFKNSRISIQQNKKKDKPAFSEDKLEKMRQLAAQIAKDIVRKPVAQIGSIEEELEDERKKRLEEKEYIKTLDPMELRQYNREKANQQEDPTINKLDDQETDISFTKALVISEKTAELYNETKIDRKKSDEVVEKYSSLKQVFAKEPKKKRRKGTRKADFSGKLEGEKIDNLVKLEVKKRSKEGKRKVENQDDYVLEKLFSKKGIHTALQHDTIVQSGSSGTNSIKMRSETHERTEIALAALRKSRLNHWRY